MFINIEEVISLIERNSLVSQLIDISIDETEERGVYKILCQLIPSKYKLQIRLISTPDDLIYSYQLFTHKPLIRWDNTPHFPKISSYPNHFHNKKGTIIKSKLTGNINGFAKLI